MTSSVASFLTPNPDANAAFRKFLVGQPLSVLGSLVSRLAPPFVLIFTLGATPLQVAWLRVAEILPGIAVALPHGCGWPAGRAARFWWW